MIKHLFIFLKGIIFGLANVIPGVSGGTMAVITKVYDKLLSSINNLFKKFKPSIIFLLVYGLGAVAGIIFGSKVLVYATSKIPFPIAMLFAGLIIGSIPFLAKPVYKKINYKYAIVFLLAMALVIGLLFVGLNVSSGNKEALDVADYFLLFVCGLLASIAMVTPGISGMMMFQIFGYYNLLMDSISHFFSNPGQNLLIFLPVGLGVIVGIFSACKIMSIILKKFPVGTRFAILGFVIASVFCLFYNAEFKVTEATLNPLQIILGIAFILFGIAASYLLAYVGERNERKALLVEDAEEKETISDEKDIESEKIEDDNQKK